MKTILYYHMYLTDNPISWLSIFHEQMNLIDSSGLLKNLNEIKITAIARSSTKNIPILMDSLSYFNGPKYEIEVLNNPYSDDKTTFQNFEKSEMISENKTVTKIYRDAHNRPDEEYALAYIHNKGITKTVECDDPHIILRYFYWRNFLNYGMLEKWKNCVSALENDGADIAGINMDYKPSLHYSGNFWWTKASHVRKLPDPSKLDWWDDLRNRTSDQWLKTCSNRFRNEMWLGSIPNINPYNVISFDRNPAFETIKKSEYLEL